MIAPLCGASHNHRVFDIAIRGDILKSTRKARGYSLVELMVVVAIIGVISAIAYPSYQSYIEDTYFAQMQADVKVCALTLDRLYTTAYTYDGIADANCNLWSPADSAEASARYDITVPVESNSAYQFCAEPVTGGCDNRCYRLNSDGSETVNNTAC